MIIKGHLGDMWSAHTVRPVSGRNFSRLVQLFAISDTYSPGIAVD